MRLLGATLIAATMLLPACAGGEERTAPSAPAPAAVGVELQTAQPQYPRGTAPKIDMVLRNDGGQPCKLPSTATGAVEVMSVTRDGQAVIGKGGTDYYYNGLSAVVADNLQSVPPGQSLTVPLDIETNPNSPPTLVVSLQTPSDEGRTTSWPLDQPGQYRITARPAQVAGITDMCAVPSTSSTVEFRGAIVRWPAAIAVAVCTAVPGLAGVASAPPAARAAIDAGAGTAGGLDECGELFTTTDPAGVWSRVNDPNSPVVKVVKVTVPVNGDGTKTHRPDGPNDPIVISWDPNRTVVLDGLSSSPCETLYHELQHAADDQDGLPESTLDEECNGIANAEWRAMEAQNKLRKALGEQQMRTTYHGRPFGSDSFDDCRQKQQQKQKPPNKQTNSAFGDPHITTTDGLIYDLQQVGEFTAFTSNDAAAPRVQLRTAPVPDSAFASIVTGAAAGNGDQRITFVLDNGRLTITHGSKNETVAVDQDSEKDLGGGMTIATAAASDNFVGSGYTVRWTDGSELDVDESGFWGLRVSFEPSDAARSNQPRGLFGTFNGDPTDDLTRPDGKVVPVDSSDDVIRSQFGDEWRIAQGDSLFPYGAGLSTETFADRKFPSAQPQFSPAVSDQARSVCNSAGVIGDAILAACVFDVSVTGNPALAQTAAHVSRESTVTAVAGEPLNSKGFGSGLAVSGAVRSVQPVSYEFTAKAGEVANVRSVCTPTGKNITYTVALISGQVTDPVGVVDGCTDLGRVAFATDGTYRLVINGEGQYGITWQATPGDVHRTLNLVTPNAGHVAAGTRHYYRFIVAPGQQWTFTPTGACTQISGFTWSVVDATGALNDRGIMDGCGAIGPLLLAPGQYDVRIDAVGNDADYRFTATS